jgi:hypothetical protein
MCEKVNDQWDGRPSFYPSCGYYLDTFLQANCMEICERTGLQHPFEEHSNEDDETSNVDDRDDESSGKHVKGSISLPRKVVYSPPVYDQKDHYHEMYDADQVYSCFQISKTGRLLYDTLIRPQRTPEDKKWSTKIAETAMGMIKENRKDIESIDAARRGSLLLCAEIKGLRSGAPLRYVEVPGELPLSALHDRVLCPIFGWTRGFHDYRFVVRPSGYRYSPPKIPMLDIVFGASGLDNPVALVNQHGFYGTLRQADSPTVPDSAVCAVADLLQEPGHRLWHVLGQPGCKTEITVIKVE